LHDSTSQLAALQLWNGETNKKCLDLAVETIFSQPFCFISDSDLTIWPFNHTTWQLSMAGGAQLELEVTLGEW